MSQELPETRTEPVGDLEKVAHAPSLGLLAEFWEFLRENKKWYLLPIIAVLLLVAVLLLLAGTAAAPFIYPLF